MLKFSRNLLLFLAICFIACSADPILGPIEIRSPKDSVNQGQQYFKDSMVVMQWNIGHFSNGKDPYSQVSDASFEEISNGFMQLIDSVSADIVSVCEYSMLFANTPSHPSCYADTLLFHQFPIRFFGNNGVIRHYSLNAILSKIVLTNPTTIEYVANQTATITHTTRIKATDYYYNKASLTIGNRDVVFINTHLAFDANNPEIAINQIRELIDILKDDEYVIICGDFNTTLSSYSFFTDAGYSLANTGEWGTFPSAKTLAPLDNIITKGLVIRDAYVIKSSLSDHYPIVCTVSVVDE